MRKRQGLALLLALFLAFTPSLARELGAAAGDNSAPQLIVITGLGGDPAYDERFHTWAATLMDSASDRFGLNDANIIYLAGDPERDPGRSSTVSRRENVLTAFRKLAEEDASEGLLLVVVIGHGTYRDGISKVNLPGPDMTSEDFAAALEPFGDRPVVFANLTSASGELIGTLSRPGWTVITATRSGSERNATVFARFFVAAFLGDEADADNDDRLSILEAFLYARSEVERAYATERQLLTEHALLDDNGDGVGSREPGRDAEDGRLAATLSLTGTGNADRRDPEEPELFALHEKKAELEKRIADLRRRKESLSKKDYEDQLEELLIEMALNNRAIRNHRHKADAPP